jgi:hypothetical protein
MGLKSAMLESKYETSYRVGKLGKTFPLKLAVFVGLLESGGRNSSLIFST